MYCTGAVLEVNLMQMCSVREVVGGGLTNPSPHDFLRALNSNLICQPKLHWLLIRDFSLLIE